MSSPGRDPNDDPYAFDIDAWLDEHDDAPAREELESRDEDWSS